MKPPKRVRVGPHVYRILGDKDGLLDRAQRVGQCCTGTLTIAYDKSQKKSQVADTIVHEILHACFGQLGLDEGDEERIVLALAPQLLSVLVDNPELVRWLERSATSRVPEPSEREC